jgi:hypothetical protein
MSYKVISLALVVLLLHGRIVAQDWSQPPAQTVAKTQQVLHKAQGKNKTVKVTLRTAIDHRKTFAGVVSDISDNSFVLGDQKTQATRSFTYEEVQQIKQKGMSKGTKLLIVGVVVLGGVIAMGFAVACNVDGGPHC